MVVYTGGTQAQTAALLEAHDVTGRTYEPLESLSFPGMNGLWTIGSNTQWDCTAAAHADVVQKLLDEAERFIFALDYAETLEKINVAMGHLACRPVHSLIGRAMFLRAMVACNSGGGEREQQFYGDADQTVMFLEFANAADPAIEWNRVYSPTCAVVDAIGNIETLDVKANFEFAKTKAQEATVSKESFQPLTRFMTIELAINANGHVVSPSMLELRWTLHEQEYSRIAMVHEAPITLVDEAAWRQIIAEGPSDNATAQNVIVETFKTRDVLAVDIAVLNRTPPLLYAYYPGSKDVPFHVYTLAPAQTQEPTKGAFGAAVAWQYAGNAHFVGPRLVGRVRLVKGLHLTVGGGLGINTPNTPHLFLLPTVEAGAQYVFEPSRVHPHVGGRALFTFSNNPASPPVYVVGLACGGVSVKVSDHLLAPFFEACGGGGSLTFMTQVSLGMLFQ